MDDARARLASLPPRPSIGEVVNAQREIFNIERNLAQKVEEIIRKSNLPQADDLTPEESRVIQGAEFTSAKSEADKLKSKYLPIIALEEQYSRFEAVIQNGGAFVDVPGQDSTISREEAARKLVLEIETAANENSTELDLSNRGIVSLPEKIGLLTSLKALDLSNNELETIPDSVTELANLEVLNLSKNRLRNLPNLIGALTHLRVLNASKNRITELPGSLWVCGNLEELDLFYNKLESLPSKFGDHLPHLKKLNLGFNKIQNLPFDIGSLSELVFFDAHFNRIRKVPDSIGNLTKLEYLDISDNFADLVEIPASLSNLFNLRTLKLANNQLTELPVEFGRLSELQTLAIEGNPWVEPPYELVKQNSHSKVMEYLQQRYRDSQNPEDANLATSYWVRWIRELLSGGNWQFANWLSVWMAETPASLITNGAHQGENGGKSSKTALLELKEVDLEIGGHGKAETVA